MFHSTYPHFRLSSRDRFLLSIIQHCRQRLVNAKTQKNNICYPPACLLATLVGKITITKSGNKKKFLAFVIRSVNRWPLFGATKFAIDRGWLSFSNNWLDLMCNYKQKFWAVLLVQLVEHSLPTSESRSWNSNHWQILNSVNCIEKMKIKKKEAGNDQFLMCNCQLNRLRQLAEMRCCKKLAFSVPTVQL